MKVPWWCTYWECSWSSLSFWGHRVFNLLSADRDCHHHNFCSCRKSYNWDNYNFTLGSNSLQGLRLQCWRGFLKRIRSLKILSKVSCFHFTRFLLCELGWVIHLSSRHKECPWLRFRLGWYSRNLGRSPRFRFVLADWLSSFKSSALRNGYYVWVVNFLSFWG